MKGPLDKLLTCLKIIALVSFLALWVTGRLYEHGCWWL